MLPKEDFRLLLVAVLFLTLLIVWAWPSPTSVQPSPWVFGFTPP
jgi:hypothetical protein